MSSDSQMVKRVGNYELGKTLGKGTFSKVKYAVDIRTGKAWAVKIVDRQKVIKEHMEAQLKREITIMKMMRHPNIVNLNEVLQTQRNIYIVLELITGGELFDRIVQAKRFDEDTARYFFQQLIVGIEYCHKNNIAHRDLKPENLLLDEKDVLKISDFGLSALSDSPDAGKSELLTTTCGTPNYVAPEVLAEKGYDGFKADIWSCGVILYVMIAGALPFDDPSLNVLFQKIEKGEYKTPRWFSPEVADFISKMLVVDPKKRLTIPQIKKNPWFAKNFKDEADAAHASAPTAPVGSSQDFQNAEETESAESAIPKPTMNAFDLAAHLMAGTMTGLVSGPSGKSKKSPQFMAEGKAPDVIRILMGGLTKIGCSPQMKSSGVFIKCSRRMQRDIVQFTVEVTKTVSDTLCLVEMNRIKGDALEFNELVRHIIEEVKSIVSKQSLDDMMARATIAGRN
eukprot:ANDGO_06098.mRNA.1 CBL-interacting serine/threonine-protein kinase 26